MLEGCGAADWLGCADCCLIWESECLWRRCAGSASASLGILMLVCTVLSCAWMKRSKIQGGWDGLASESQSAGESILLRSSACCANGWSRSFQSARTWLLASARASAMTVSRRRPSGLRHDPQLILEVTPALSRPQPNMYEGSVDFRSRMAMVLGRSSLTNMSLWMMCARESLQHPVT